MEHYLHEYIFLGPASLETHNSVSKYYKQIFHVRIFKGRMTIQTSRMKETVHEYSRNHFTDWPIMQEGFMKISADTVPIEPDRKKFSVVDVIRISDSQ